MLVTKPHRVCTDGHPGPEPGGLGETGDVQPPGCHQVRTHTSGGKSASQSSVMISKSVPKSIKD